MKTVVAASLLKKKFVFEEPAGVDEKRPTAEKTWVATTNEKTAAARALKTIVDRDRKIDSAVAAKKIAFVVQEPGAVDY